MKFIITFITVLIFWLMLSGEFKPLLLGFAVVYSAIVAVMTKDLFMRDADKGTPVRLLKFFLYLPWLMKEILVANIQVVKIVLSPSMPIDPVMVKEGSELKTDIGLTTLGNSITLTPGTVTVDIEDGELLVHAIDAAAEKGITDRVIEKKVLEIERAG
ncbi:Na+/H+ antiporter subunit E [Limisalsivibrio acetivorans]|uniref:Na+/H+ antiporter subunit E n=1 Tax=Limisalsivibrio acetivorans TaxID=1304888 RepID=UPI0003B7A1CA|nr:Na+/H+ antiporter subunit E [Limisalsivibrio acetivorans]